MKSRISHFLALAVLAFGLLISGPKLGFCQESKPKTADDELFDNLESDLFDGLDLPPADSGKPNIEPSDDTGSDSTNPKPRTDDPTDNPTGDPKFDPLPGEDIGQPPERTPNPLLEVTEAMKKVESRFREQDTTTETQELQKEILSKLDELIAAAEKNKKPAPSPSSPRNNGNNDQKQDENMGDSQSGSSSGRGGPARESTDDRDPVTGGDVELSGQNVLMKRVWGQLPEKIREEILTQSVEEFLPEYRNLIEDYYKRLAKESSTSP